MPTADSLTGLGMPGNLAELIGGNPSALTTTGTAQGTAAIIKSKNTELVTAGSQTGAIPPSTVGIMQPYFIVNPTATSGIVYVPSGHTIAGTLNGGITLAQNKAMIMWQYKRLFWSYVILA